jgi:hypothetical protein
MTRTIAGLLLGCMLMTSACSDKNSVPSDVLPHEKMEAVMWDVIQSEQYSANYLIKDSAHLDLKLENLRMYDEIFRLHQTSREQFRKSYQYYMGRADLAQTLFDSLLNKGNRLRTESYSRPSRTIATPPPAPAKTPAAVPSTVPAGTPASAPTSVPSLRDSLLKKHLPLLSPKQRDSLIKRRKIPA